LVPTWTLYIVSFIEALASRDLEPKLLSALQEAVKVVNFVKARPLNSRLFAVLCEEIQADHKSLLVFGGDEVYQGVKFETISWAERRSSQIFTGLWFSTRSTLFR
jgi:hypothetical protein